MGHRFAERTRAKHATLHALLAAGHGRSVARQLGMSQNTVLRFSRADRPEVLFDRRWQNRTSVLDEYKPCLDDRWTEGCTNAWNSGRRSRLSATKAATSASAPTCIRSAPRLSR